MKLFENPEITIEKFEIADIITTSNGENDTPDQEL